MKSIVPHLESAAERLREASAITPARRQELEPYSVVADALLMRLQAAGEQLAAARALAPPEFAACATTRWNKLIGLRNIISHGYTAIDYDLIYAAAVDLQPLIESLERAIARSS